MASDSSLLGAAGEYFVMSELLRRGYIAALAPQGIPNADIVVTDVRGSQLCSVQVKSRRDIGSDGGWHMKAKHERERGARLFYCFVDFGKSPQAQPRVLVLPSAVVADVLSKSHARWLSQPSKNGRAHKDGPMRRFLPDYTRIFGTENPYPLGWLKEYESAWQLLKLDTAPVEEALA